MSETDQPDGSEIVRRVADAMERANDVFIPEHLWYERMATAAIDVIAEYLDVDLAGGSVVVSATESDHC